MEATINDFFYNTSRQLKAKSDPVTDEQLLLEYRQTGDRELYAQLVYRYERELFSYLRRYLGNAETAEDVFQTAFLSVHLKCQTFKEGRRFRPWLYSIATNAAIDCRRMTKRRPTVSLDTPHEQDADSISCLIDYLESSDPNPSDSALDAERSRLVRATLDRLPESMNAIIQLVYYQGMRYKEAAEVLNVPVGTVKSRLHNAVRRLADIWNTHSVDE
jgi:RNA polymerase sigma-70 factor (ECF subfamily)